ncbi:MAG: GAF domain-containing protein, partial [Gammaproteobacteria bacterium]
MAHSNKTPVPDCTGADCSAVETELEALYQVSRVLNQSLDFRETLCAVLEVLHDYAKLDHGMLSLLDEESGELFISALHKKGPLPFESVRYKQGEGVLGSIMSLAEPLIISRLGDDQRFLDRLGVYDTDLPFIGVPITLEQEPIGVLTAQPMASEGVTQKSSRFMQMVANLIGQSLLL